MNRYTILKSQKNKEGSCMIYLESDETQNGKRVRKRKPSGIRVKPKNWSDAKRIVLSGDPIHEDKNSHLEEFISSAKTRTSQLKDINYKKKFLTDWIEEYIELRKSRGTKRSSFKEFITLTNRLKRFQNYAGADFTFEDINLIFSDQFIIWHSKEGFDPNTIHKTFSALKTVLNHYYDRKQELKISLGDEFRNVKFGKVQTHSSPPLPLSSEEYEHLVFLFHLMNGTIAGFGTIEDDSYNNILFELEPHEKVFDAFLLACSTGLRFSDIHRIKPNMIRNDILYIEPVKTETTKKDNLCKIPLNYASYGILDKYNFDTYSLKMTNQHYNRILKIIMKSIGFDDPVTIKMYSGLGEPIEKTFPKHDVISSHNARDTFITFSIKVGIDIPSIMEMTGHTKYDTMKKYIKLDDNHLIQSMNKWGNASIKFKELANHKKKIVP